MVSSKNTIFIGFLLAALVVVAVMVYVGVTRFGEIEAAVERRWREEAEAFLRDSAAEVRKEWEEAEAEILDVAEWNARSGAEAPEDLEAASDQFAFRSSEGFINLYGADGVLLWGIFVLDAQGKPVVPTDWGPAWRPYAESGPRDEEGSKLFAEAELLEFREGKLAEAHEAYETLGTETYGLTLRSRARMAAGAVAAKLSLNEKALSHYRYVVDDPGKGGIDPWIRALARYRIGVCQEESGDVAGAVETFRALAGSLTTTKRSDGTFPGMEMSARSFFIRKVFEDLERIWPGKKLDMEKEPWILITGPSEEELGTLRWRWRRRLAEIETLALISTSVQPAIKRARDEGGRMRVPAESRGEPVVLFLEKGDGDIWLGGYVQAAVLKAQLNVEERHADSLFELLLRMPGEGDPVRHALASMPLFPNLDSAVLFIRNRDPEAPARETSRRRASLLGLLGLAAVVLLAGTVLVLRRLKKEMDLSRLKSDFFANVSHDLRTPLTIIRSSAETLRLGRVTDEEKKARYMDQILKETQRIDALVGNVLEASRIELGRKRYDFAPLSPGALLAEVEEARRFYLEEEGFDFQVSAEEGLPEVRADVEALRLALYNLIENAVKYSGERREISLKALRRDREVVFRVEDRGRGIAPQDRERIFERFVRARSGFEAGNGVGLGLALVLEAVKAHSGRIEVEDREGGGTAFEIRLPVQP